MADVKAYLSVGQGQSSASLRVWPDWTSHPALYVNFQCASPPVYDLACYCTGPGVSGTAYRNWLRPDLRVKSGDVMALCAAVVAGHWGAWLGLVDWLLDYGPEDWKPYLPAFVGKEFLPEGAVP